MMLRFFAASCDPGDSTVVDASKCTLTVNALTLQPVLERLSLAGTRYLQICLQSQPPHKTALIQRCVQVGI